MAVPVGLNVWSRLAEELFPYLDQVVGPFDSLWFPDYVQYEHQKVAKGWNVLAFALARYPDKLCGDDVLCNSFSNPAHLAKMAATARAISGGRLVRGLGAGWNAEEYQAYGWPFPSARAHRPAGRGNSADPRDVDERPGHLPGAALPGEQCLL